MNYLGKLIEGVEMDWKTLEEVAFFANGKGHEKEIKKDGKFIVVNSKFISTSGKIAKYSNNQICPLFVDDILIVMSDLPNGRALAKTFLIDQNDRYTLNQRIGRIAIRNERELLPKFLKYYLDRTPQLLRFNNGIDQTNLQKKQILDVNIPIPFPENPEKSIKIQKEIVSILDSFTILTTGLVNELTTELETRKKQYEYFRNRLLSFPKDNLE